MSHRSGKSHGSSNRKYSAEFPLHTAANEGDLDKVKLLIQQNGLDMINSVDSHLMTPLHLAAHQGRTAVLFTLLGYTSGEGAGLVRVAKVNSIDVYRRTPLHIACSAGHMDVVTELLTLNKMIGSRRQTVVELDIQDVNGRTPVITCLRKGLVDILRLLLEAGADPNIQDDYLQSSLHYACAKPKASLMWQTVECLKLLMKYGADINLADARGDTAVHICARGGYLQLIQIMLEDPYVHRWLPKVQNQRRQTALQVALKEGNEEIIALLQAKQTEVLLNTLRMRQMSTWMQSDVADWIECIGYPQYRDNFVRNNISGAALTKLTIDSLKTDIQIGSFGHRNDISGKIATFSIMPVAKPIQVVEQDFEALLKQANQWEIDSKDLVMGDVIGKGYFGEVRRATWKGVEVAVKYMYRALAHDKDRLMFHKEILILSQLRHPNIITLLGFVRTPEGGIMMVTELMNGGTLYHLIKHNFQTLDRIRTRIILDIVRGMTYLHSRSPPVLHRDLNSKNLLLDDHYMTKLSDFGLSRHKDDLKKMTSNVGFLANIAPEVFKGDKYSEKADVFSFSIVLYELFTGKEPHEGIDILKYANKVAHENFRPTLPPDDVLHPEWKKLIRLCWDQNPDHRPSFQQIIEIITSLTQGPAKVPISPSKAQVPFSPQSRMAVSSPASPQPKSLNNSGGAPVGSPVVILGTSSGYIP